MAGRITMSEEQLRPDPVSTTTRSLAKFINCIMYDGKKSVAQRVMYDAMDEIDERLERLRARRTSPRTGSPSSTSPSRT
jgi:small subunit ribosomal protein S7